MAMRGVCVPLRETPVNLELCKHIVVAIFRQS